MKWIFTLALSLFIIGSARSTQILVPMDGGQTNHLKAYGVAYWMLENEVVIEWLLNYRGGSFLCPHLKSIEEELLIRGVKYELITDGQANGIKNQIANPEVNQEVVQLEKAPKIGCILPRGRCRGTMRSQWYWSTLKFRMTRYMIQRS